MFLESENADDLEPEKPENDGKTDKPKPTLKPRRAKKKVSIKSSSLISVVADNDSSLVLAKVSYVLLSQVNTFVTILKRQGHQMFRSLNLGQKGQLNRTKCRTWRNSLQRGPDWWELDGQMETLLLGKLLTHQAQAGKCH